VKKVKKTFFICFLLTVLLLSFPVFAEDMQIVLSETSIIGYTGESVSTEFTIQNLQDETDSFDITLWPPYWLGISATLEKSTVTIDANSNETVNVYLTIPIAVEELMLNYNITVKSVTDEEISDSQTLALRVIRRVPIYISDVKLSKYVLDPMESFKIEVSVTNLDAQLYSQASLQTNIKKDEAIVQRFDDTVEIPATSTQKIENSFAFDKYTDPGTYKIETILKDKLNRIVSTKETTLKLNAVYNITHEKIMSYSLLLQTASIIVKNEGNAPSTSFYITEDIPSFMGPIVQPVGHYTVETIQNRIFYHWLVPSLMPGEERVVKYQLNLWNVWIITLVIIFSVVFGFKYVFTPKVVKSFTHAGRITRGKEIIVSLDVRNRSRKKINDVEIRDFIPSILGVVGKYDTLRPKVRKVKGGTELIWNFDSLKPREERVITYRIKPSVDVMGSLKLPKAQVKYIDKKKVKKMMASKSVVIKPR